MSGGKKGSLDQDASFRGWEKVAEGERTGLYKGTEKRPQRDMERT